MNEQEIIHLYTEKKMSTHEIAQKFNTYPNKINRVLKKHEVQLRSRNDAARINVEKNGPKKLKESTKLKISEFQGKLWENATDERKQERIEHGKKCWDKKTASERDALIRQGQQTAQQASRIGSKMEHSLLETLTSKGFKVEFHKEHWLQNHRLQLDLFIPAIRTVIEVDGPSHFKPVWGMENLIKNQKADRQKTGLVLGQDLVLIRVKMEKKFSQRYARQTAKNLLNILNSIKKQYPNKDERYFEL
tara:strand:+ start:874 stop:1614 length:741 start_codon:yes stop_codon:yes gene_type:complete